MSYLFQIADNCNGLGPFVAIIKNGVLPIVWIGIPIVLIIFGVVDLGKAVISSEDKEVKQAQSRLIKRCIYAIVIFFIVTLVQLVMGLVAKGAGGSSGVTKGEVKGWQACWDNPKG